MHIIYGVAAIFPRGQFGEWLSIIGLLEYTYISCNKWLLTRKNNLTIQADGNYGTLLINVFCLPIIHLILYKNTLIH